MRSVRVTRFAVATAVVCLCSLVAVASAPPAPTFGYTPRADATLVLDTPTTAFTFSAAGDYNWDHNATSHTLASLAGSGVDFHLALGDLSYDDSGDESKWCEYVKGFVGPNFRFELLAGNHEDFNTDPSDGVGGNINNFATCLPNMIPNITGTYAREYYFDYPQDDPLARIIMISPALSFEDGRWDYTAGSDHFNWVSSAIDDARSRGISWVIVGMHKPCLSMGEQSCDVGADLLNLLVSKRVDLVLQGHDHTYQRSRSLVLSDPDCPVVVPDSFAPACVAPDQTDHQYTKGEGTVFLIVGTAGAEIRTINPADAEAGYFVEWMGSNLGRTSGYELMRLDSSGLSGVFVPTAAGDFTDTFTITADSPPLGLRAGDPGGRG